MTAYLDPVRDEIARLREDRDTYRAAWEQAEAANANLTGLLTLRSAALNRTGTQNDTLRATVAACPSCRNRLEPTT